MMPDRISKLVELIESGKATPEQIQVVVDQIRQTQPLDFIQMSRAFTAQVAQLNEESDARFQELLNSF